MASDFGDGAGLIEGGQAVSKFAETMYDNAQRAEVSDVSTRIAKARAEWTVKLQERAQSSDPGDITFADKFKEDFDNHLSTMGDNLSTEAGRRAWATQSSELSSHFTQTAGLYQASSVGAKAKQDYLTLLDANRTTLVNDPTQHDSVMATTLAALNDPNGTYYRMPADERLKLERQTRNEIGLSTVQGAIRMDPSLALKQLNEGRWDKELDADKKAALLAAADTAIRGRMIAAEHATNVARREQTDAWRKTTDTLFMQIQTGDPKVVDSILNADLPALGEYSKNTMLNLVKKADKIEGDEKTYGPGFLGAMKDIQNGTITKESDLTALLGEANGITMSGLNQARLELQGRRTVDGIAEAEMKKRFITGVESEITQTTLFGKDPKGDAQMSQFMMWFLPEYQRQREAGKSPVQLLDRESPDSLYKGAPKPRPPMEVLKDSFDASKMGGKKTAPGGVEMRLYKNADEVRDDYQKGKITREEAAKILIDQGWAPR